ncbi:MAG TPA: phosphoenolpyruvate carboxylase, partial [Ktedonobacteraceae bacterium]|nr:phosphoenolpyruvate carboxylase [Ktedonobacteraceae bacterium]
MPEQTGRSEKDAALRHDIRMLGEALGHAIQQHGGTSVFETVERLRRTCKRLRSCAEALPRASEAEAAQLQAEIAALDQEILRIVDGCDLDTSIDVIRAFTVYFHLVNTAEQHHRTRRRYTHETIAPSTPQRGSLAALVDFFKCRGLAASSVQRLLDQLSIELVFTAHPTEATRRSLITKSRQVAALLKAHDRADDMTPRERANWRRELESTIGLL